MSETIAEMVYRKSPSFTMRLPASTYDKARAQLKDNEELLNIYLPALLIADESTYHMISHEDLLTYLNVVKQRREYLQMWRTLALFMPDADERRKVVRSRE